METKSPSNSSPEYCEGAVAELKRQLANAKTEGSRRKIENKLKKWEKK